MNEEGENLLDFYPDCYALGTIMICCMNLLEVQLEQRILGNNDGDYSGDGSERERAKFNYVQQLDT